MSKKADYFIGEKTMDDLVNYPHGKKETPVSIPCGNATINGDLNLVEKAKGVVLFAHGSGSSRFSPRNRHVATQLNNAGLATLLIDLLTRDEEAVDELTAELRFNIAFLGERLLSVTDWVKQNNSTRNLKLGYFGASTGAAAALAAASKQQDIVSAIVSRGGRPDLAKIWLPNVKAPTLLIVGGNDTAVIEMNKQALEKLDTKKKLVLVPGATHLFEEPGALDEVAILAGDWFTKHLAPKKHMPTH
jgi:putative phosphoribosyl transferase